MNLYAWITSIVGVSALGILIDVLLPDSEMSNYLRSVFGIVIVLVIASPLPALINGKSHITDAHEGRMVYRADTDFLDYALGERERIKEEFLESLINEELRIECNIDIRSKSDKRTPQYVFVDIYEDTISEDVVNIDIKKEIELILATKVGVSKDCIEVHNVS